ncbi:MULTISPECIES: cysteine desulfurase-like protein [unclassified Moritella]|uniref:cysteine desulfurase-like protein n=1 Tax=unclassified Moritella TaxID=2637987 RepID=UPI001BA71587|nr:MULTISPECIES: cysteine desulfurase-like protein [unclassified Moritella]QUM84028.1 cysteine desulfurase-like protein [Moritella sp. 28]QUM88337.1 cysteine desulfurase-like protein [Moritella sp. 36]
MNLCIESIRQAFPALQQQVNGESVYFFDGPGGSQVPQSVLDAMTAYLGKYNSNLGGRFFSSEKTVDVMRNARLSGQALLNTPSPDNIVFGANMTSLTFQLSRAISRDWKVGDEVIVTSLDHYSNVSTWQQAADDKGALVHQARVNEADCTLDCQHLISLISNKTKLVALTFASNTTGSLVDVKQIIEAAHAVGAKVYIDAVHYAPHKLVDVQALGCDFLACSAYKFFGPHVGIAYVAPQWLHTLSPYKVEPATNQGPGRFETGTQSFEALAGFSAAVEYLAHAGDEALPLRERLVQSFELYQAHEQQLSQHFLEKLAQYSNVTLYGINDMDRLAERTPTFSIRIDHASPEDVSGLLGQHNMCVWNGHFYAIGLCKQLDILDKGGVIRIGFMHYNTTSEIDALFDVLATVLIK